MWADYTAGGVLSALASFDLRATLNPIRSPSILGGARCKGSAAS